MIIPFNFVVSVAQATPGDFSVVVQLLYLGQIPDSIGGIIPGMRQEDLVHVPAAPDPKSVQGCPPVAFGQQLLHLLVRGYAQKPGAHLFPDFRQSGQANRRDFFCFWGRQGFDNVYKACIAKGIEHEVREIEPRRRGRICADIACCPQGPAREPKVDVVEGVTHIKRQFSVKTLYSGESITNCGQICKIIKNKPYLKERY